jgi:hypothetical protein
VERWSVSVDKGDVAVSQRRIKSDCTVRGRKSLFDDIAGGRENALAALLRGAIEIDGEPSLLARFQRLFPGPPRTDASGKKPGRAGKR